MQEIYYDHNIGTPFVESDYKEVLGDLEAEGKIVATPSAEKRRIVRGKRTFANSVIVKFPEV